MAFRWGVIGTGIIANKVFREVTATGRHAVSGAFSRTRAKAEKFCSAFGGKVFSSAEELLESPELDGVYIATPHSEHYRFARLALEMKKPALVEKSLTVNAPQAEALRALSIETGVYFSEAMWMRFSPVAATVKAWVEAGAIGKIEKIEADFSFNLHVGQSTDRVSLMRYAGGALLDVGVYTVSLAHFLLGAPERIECRQRYLDTGVDKSSFITLRYPNGAVAELKCGIAGAIRNAATVTGEKGKIKLPLFFAMPKATARAENFRGVVRAKSGYIYQFDTVAADVKAGMRESLPIPHADSVEVMRILDECRRRSDYFFPEEIERV